MEIASVIGALDFERISKEYWDQDEVVFVPQFLPSPFVDLLLKDVENLKPKLNRNFIPGHKKGGSISYFSILENGPSLLGLYRSREFRNFLGRLVNAELKLCPANDPHSCALYFYTEAGDHIGYHYDTSYYKGKRFTVLLGLIQKSSSRLLCRLHTKNSNRSPMDLEIDTTSGSAVIFNGDKLYHAVSPSQAGEERVIFTMEYVTNQEMGFAKRLFSNLKDAFGYFGIKSLWQAGRRTLKTNED
jgi:hypothetical protein